MAFLFLDDDSPESSEYSSNYFFFEDDSPEGITKAITMAREIIRERKKSFFSKNPFRHNRPDPVLH